MNRVSSRSSHSALHFLYSILGKKKYSTDFLCTYLEFSLSFFPERNYKIIFNDKFNFYSIFSLQRGRISCSIDVRHILSNISLYLRNLCLPHFFLLRPRGTLVHLKHLATVLHLPLSHDSAKLHLVQQFPTACLRFLASTPLLTIIMAMTMATGLYEIRQKSVYENCIKFEFKATHRCK